MKLRTTNAKTRVHFASSPASPPSGCYYYYFLNIHLFILAAPGLSTQDLRSFLQHVGSLAAPCVICFSCGMWDLLP